MTTMLIILAIPTLILTGILGGMGLSIWLIDKAAKVGIFLLLVAMLLFLYLSNFMLTNL